MRARPAVKLFCPLALAAGSTFDARVRLEATRKVPARALRVTLEGEEYATWQLHGMPTASRRWLVRLRATPDVPRHLEGVSEYPCRFELPPDAPPSYEGRGAWIRYRLEVHVDIPWWPDVRERFVLQVKAPPRDVPDGRPVFLGDRIYHLEASLDSNVVVAGEVLNGAVAFFGRPRARELQVALVATLGGGAADQGVEQARHVASFSLEHAPPEQMQRFALRVPQITPTFSSSLVKLQWHVELRVGERTLRTPVTVVGDSAPTGKPRAAPPAVGTSRLHEVWSKAAQTLGFELADETLRGSVSGVQVGLRLDVRPGGHFLLGALRYRSLGLGARIAPRVALGSGRTELHAEARDAAQARALIAGLDGALERLDVIAIDDDHAAVERKQSGSDLAKLVRFGRDVASLAGAIAEARSALPPPAAMAAHVPGWRTLAVDLGAALDQATMSIAGTLDGAPVEARTEWNGAEPTCTRLVVRPPFRLTEKLSPEQQEACRRAGEDALGLDVDADAVALRMPAGDAAPMLEQLRRLVRLAARLRDGAGVYR